MLLKARRTSVAVLSLSAAPGFNSTAIPPGCCRQTASSLSCEDGPRRITAARGRLRLAAKVPATGRSKKPRAVMLLPSQRSPTTLRTAAGRCPHPSPSAHAETCPTCAPSAGPAGPYRYGRPAGCRRNTQARLRSFGSGSLAFCGKVSSAMGPSQVALRTRTWGRNGRLAAATAPVMPLRPRTRLDDLPQRQSGFDSAVAVRSIGPGAFVVDGRARRDQLRRPTKLSRARRTTWPPGLLTSGSGSARTWAPVSRAGSDAAPASSSRSAKPASRAVAASKLFRVLKDGAIRAALPSSGETPRPTRRYPERTCDVPLLPAGRAAQLLLHRCCEVAACATRLVIASSAAAETDGAATSIIKSGRHPPPADPGPCRHRIGELGDVALPVIRIGFSFGSNSGSPPSRRTPTPPPPFTACKTQSRNGSVLCE